MGINVLINVSLFNAWLGQDVKMVNVSQIFRLMDVQQHLVQKIITVLMGIDVSIDANPFCARLELDAKMESVSLMYHLMDARQCPVQ